MQAPILESNTAGITNIVQQLMVKIMLNKNTWGVKKCGANIANRQARPKVLISAEAKKLL